MKKTFLMLIILLIASISYHAVNISNLNYQAYFAIKNDSKLALVQYNNDYLYLVKGDIIGEVFEVIDLDFEYLTLYHIVEKKEHRIPISQRAESPSFSTPAKSTVQQRQSPQTPRPSARQPAAAPGADDKLPEIYLEPQNFNITWANARATLIIMARGFTDLFSISLNITYDSSLAAVDNVNEGYFLKSRGGTTDFSSNISNGSIDIEITRLEDDGVSGNGMIASIIFRPLASGTTNFDINSITVYDSSFSPLDADITNSVVNIQIPEVDPEQQRLDEEMLRSDELRPERRPDRDRSREEPDRPFPGDFDRELPWDRGE